MLLAGCCLVSPCLYLRVEQQAAADEFVLAMDLDGDLPSGEWVAPDTPSSLHTFALP
jgi:hypothetical protein